MFLALTFDKDTLSVLPTLGVLHTEADPGLAGRIICSFLPDEIECEVLR